MARSLIDDAPDTFAMCGDGMSTRVHWMVTDAGTAEKKAAAAAAAANSGGGAGAGAGAALDPSSFVAYTSSVTLATTSGSNSRCV